MIIISIITNIKVRISTDDNKNNIITMVIILITINSEVKLKVNKTVTK